MTEQDLERIEALAEAATPGPWEWRGDNMHAAAGEDGAMSGKGDKRLHARTQASDFGDRWAATFGGQRSGKSAAIRAAYEAHEGPKILLSADGTTLARLDATPERP